MAKIVRLKIVTFLSFVSYFILVYFLIPYHNNSEFWIKAGIVNLIVCGALFTILLHRMLKKPSRG